MELLRAPADLFSPDRDALAAQWQAAFEAWVEKRTAVAADARSARARSSRPLSAASVQTYRHMFEPFRSYCAANAIGPADLAAADLQSFIGAREGRLSSAHRRSDLSARHGFRLLALIVGDHRYC